MNTTFYIAGIVKEEDGTGYSVYFPDFPNVCASGSSTEEAIIMAEDSLSAAVKYLSENRTPLPLPSPMSAVKEAVKKERKLVELPYPEDTLYQYIPAPFFDSVPVRINITLPKNVLFELDKRAKLSGMTKSGYIASVVTA